MAKILSFLKDGKPSLVILSGKQIFRKYYTGLQGKSQSFLPKNPNLHGVWWLLF